MDEPEHDARVVCRLADALHLEQRLDAAIEAYGRALALDPNCFDAWYGAGAALLAKGSYGAAAQALRRAAELRHDSVAARANLGEALYQLGDVDPALAQFREVARSLASSTSSGEVELRRLALANIACIVPGSPQAGNAAILAARRAWGAEFREALPEMCRPSARTATSKLRIGYVSSFFGAANWMKPVYGVINHHDRSRFELYLISLGSDPAPAAGYRDHPDDIVWLARQASNEELADHIRAAQLDVLIDLNGYSDQSRLALFMSRPAPLQIGWFNMFATTGLSCFDCLVGDERVIPPTEESFYSEAIARVPGTYLAFDILYPVPEPVPPPCLEQGRITFGCFGSAYKITAEVIRAWARILEAVPTARLLLKNSTLDDASNRAALRARCAAAGIADERLCLEGPADHFAFLAAYGRIDIALDTFPYNGGTTTTEALWQGVPVLAFNGDRWASRTSRSLLLAAGLGDWVAEDEPAYVDRAIALGHDSGTSERLATLRAGLREQLRLSEACASERLCRALEDIYAATAPCKRPSHPPWSS